MLQGASSLFEVELISLAEQKLPEAAQKRSLSLYRCAPLVSVPLRLRPERGFFTAEGALKYAAEHQTVSMAELAVVLLVQQAELLQHLVLVLLQVLLPFLVQ